MQIELPILQDSILTTARAGDFINLCGVLYTARDQAHKKLVECISQGESLPFDINRQAIYYCGPTPPRPDGLFGSAGPTTSARMDGYTEILLQQGLKITLGKGDRDPKIRLACQRYNALYLVTFGGAGAYLAQRIKKEEIIAYPELGAEAIYRLEVEDFPAMVAFDTIGNSIF